MDAETLFVNALAKAFYEIWSSDLEHCQPWGLLPDAEQKAWRRLARIVRNANRRSDDE